MVNKVLRYELKKSPFYKLSSKRRLANILNSSPKTINLVRDQGDNNYRKWYDENNRLIEEPQYTIKQLHNRFQQLFSRILTPTFLFSGIKGRSYVDNAKHHVNAKYLVKADILKFYPNTSIEYIFRLFRYKFEMPEDIAWLVSDLLCFEKHIPTGSPVSQNLSFFSYNEMFSEIFNLALSNNMTFSLYVDDMVFSSMDPIGDDFIFRLQGILKKFELKLKKPKLKRYGPNDSKLVTGVVISSTNEFLVPNKTRKKITETADEKSLNGLLESAKQIDPKFNV